MNNFFSPHIFIYKPQTNSVFSLFLRFILIVVFIDFVTYSFSFSFLNAIVFNYILDLIYLPEVIIVFFVLSILSEEFIDYDSIELNYWDIDLVTFFNFFFTIFLVLLAVSISYLLLQFAFWPYLIVA